jgi:hypothetical protein
MGWIGVDGEFCGLVGIERGWKPPEGRLIAGARVIPPPPPPPLPRCARTAGTNTQLPTVTAVSMNKTRVFMAHLRVQTASTFNTCDDYPKVLAGVSGKLRRMDLQGTQS